MSVLQAAGVASGVARLPIELLNDRQLHARGFIQEVDRAFIGKHPQPSMPFRETDAPFPIRSVPPTLGEHNKRNTRRLARAFRCGNRSAQPRRHHRNRDADGGAACEREEAGGGLMAAAGPAQRKSEAVATGGSQALISVRGLGIRFKTSHGVWQATRKIDFDIAARRARRHRRRKRLRQDHHRSVDPAAAAEQSRRPRRIDPVRRNRSGQM